MPSRLDDPHTAFLRRFLTSGGPAVERVEEDLLEADLTGQDTDVHPSTVGRGRGPAGAWSVLDHADLLGLVGQRPWPCGRHRRRRIPPVRGGGGKGDEAHTQADLRSPLRRHPHSHCRRDSKVAPGSRESVTIGLPGDRCYPGKIAPETTHYERNSAIFLHPARRCAGRTSHTVRVRLCAEREAVAVAP